MSNVIKKIDAYLLKEVKISSKELKKIQKEIQSDIDDITVEVRDLVDERLTDIIDNDDDLEDFESEIQVMIFKEIIKDLK